ARDDGADHGVPAAEEVVVGGAEVDGELDAVGDDVDRVRVDGQAADGEDGRVGELLHGAFEGGDHLRRGGEGVLAVGHGGGAGVVGFAVDGDAVLASAGDGADDGEALVAPPHAGTLLDVDFDQAEVAGGVEAVFGE